MKQLICRLFHKKYWIKEYIPHSYVLDSGWKVECRKCKLKFEI